MSDDFNVTSLPAQDLALDLDSATRDDAKPPFRVKVGDKVIQMIDPQDLDWRDLLAMQDPREFIRLSVSAEDREHLASTPMPGWKFAKLMESFYRHFDLEELAERARREQALSGPRGI